jgi:serine/threonine-protein kinase RsbW/stage II sporulation protein AB (anti-sigma F factor)
MRDDLIIALPSEPVNVARFRTAAVAEAARHGAGKELQRSIALAVSEAASNAIVHAYREGDGEIRLHVTLEDEACLRVAVADDGPGLTPRPDSPGYGVGLPLIAQLADDLQVVAERGTTLVMRFALTA